MKVTEDISLLGFNSFGVEARAARLVEWDTSAELAELFSGGSPMVDAGGSSGRWMALGGGNNILFTRDYDGTLVKSAALGIEITGRDDERIAVRAEAGVDWDAFVGWCVSRGFWGAENLSGIPGTVGASPIQNIGAYGAEVKDIVTSVEYLDVASLKVSVIPAGDCRFGYRDSVFKGELRGRAIVTAVNFALWLHPRPKLDYAALSDRVAALGGVTLENIRRAVTEIRGEKLPDPTVTGNAGSFFKNPVVAEDLAGQLTTLYPGMPRYPAAEAGRVKLSAGWLIEQAGWKGRTDASGRVGIHPLQALIVVNRGGATGREIVNFANSVRGDVKARFGVELETEVNIC